MLHGTKVPATAAVSTPTPATAGETAEAATTKDQDARTKRHTTIAVVLSVLAAAAVAFAGAWVYQRRKDVGADEFKALHGTGLQKGGSSGGGTSRGQRVAAHHENPMYNLEINDATVIPEPLAAASSFGGGISSMSDYEVPNLPRNSRLASQIVGPAAALAASTTTAAAATTSGGRRSNRAAGRPRSNSALNSAHAPRGGVGAPPPRLRAATASGVNRRQTPNARAAMPDGENDYDMIAPRRRPASVAVSSFGNRPSSPPQIGDVVYSAAVSKGDVVYDNGADPSTGGGGGGGGGGGERSGVSDGIADVYAVPEKLGGGVGAAGGKKKTKKKKKGVETQERLEAQQTKELTGSAADIYAVPLKGAAKKQQRQVLLIPMASQAGDDDLDSDDFDC